MNKAILILTAFASFLLVFTSHAIAFQSVPPNKTITGTVVAPDGSPATGAKLILVWGMSQKLTTTIADDRGTYSFDALSDEDGRFSYLSVYHPSGAIQSKSATGLRKKSLKIDFNLKKADTVAVACSGPDGKPIKSGKIRLKSRSRRVQSGFEFLNNAQDIPEVPIQNGTANIEFLRIGDSINIEVVADGLPPQSTYFTVSQKHDLELRRRATVKGMVVDADNIGKFENVQLRFASHQGSAGGMRSETTVIVKNDGTFETDQLCEGKLTLSSHRTFKSKWYIVESFHGQSPDAPKLTSVEPASITLTMKQAKQIEGRVTDVAGNAIPGVVMSLGSGLQTTDEDGKFSGFFPPGTAHGQIRSVPKGFLAPVGFGSLYVAVPNKDTKSNVPDIQLEKADPVSGVVIDELGNPVADANVMASWMARSSDQTFSPANDHTTTNENGEFTLENTSGTVATTIKASSPDRASLDEITVRPGASRIIEVAIGKSARLSSIGKIVDSDGKPIADAKLEFWYHGKGSSSVMFFDEGRKFSVNKNGEFKTPPKMTRGTKYSLIVEAPGFSSAKIEKKETPPVGDLDFGTIKLVAANQVSGRIVDTRGQPISGATVWSFGSSPTRQDARQSCQSDTEGNFLLSGISSDAHFFFVDHENFRFRGARIKSPEKNRSIQMARFDQPSLDNPVEIQMGSSELREAATVSMLNAIIDDPDAPASRFTCVRASKLLAKINPDFVTELLGALRQDESKVKVLLSAGKIHPAIELARTLESQTAFGLLTLAINNSSQREYQSGVELSQAQKRKLLAEASAIAANAKSADLKIQQHSRLVTEFRALGDHEQARSIIQKIKPLAKKTELNDFVAGMFAVAVAPDDPELALKVINGIERDFSKSRWFGNAFAASAKSGHDAVQKFIAATEDPSDVAGRLYRAVYDLAKLDLDKTIMMVENAQDRYAGLNKARCYSNIAMSIYSTEPERAKQLLRKAFGMIADQTRYTDSVSFTMLRHAQFIDPESTGEYWWRAVSLYGGPNPDNPNRTREIETQERRASLALLLALYDRFPETQSILVEPLFEYWEAVDPDRSLIKGTRRRAPAGIDFRDSLRTMTAMALYDPDRSTALMQKWWPSAYERFNTSPDAAWIIVGDVLTADGDQLSRLISKRLFYQWILGEDDQY